MNLINIFFVIPILPFPHSLVRDFSRTWNGHLVAVVAVDGHNWMYPMAYGFIASETTNDWTWFMKQLKKAIGEPPLLAFISDACKGLENAVKNVFPNAE